MRSWGGAPRAVPLVVGCVWRVAPEQGGSAPVRSCRGSCGFASAPTGTGDAPALEMAVLAPAAGSHVQFPGRPSPARSSRLAVCARTGS